MICDIELAAAAEFDRTGLKTVDIVIPTIFDLPGSLF